MHGPRFSERVEPLMLEAERLVSEGAPDDWIAPVLRAASLLHLPMTKLTHRAGLTRTRGYKILERTDGEIQDAPDATLRVICGVILDDASPAGIVGVASHLQVALPDVQTAMRWLQDQGAAEPLVRVGDGQGRVTDEFWIPGEDYARWLSTTVQNLRWVKGERWAVYVRLPSGVAQAVADAAHSFSPAATVIRAGTASAVTWDEFAVAIRATDGRDALAQARDAWEHVTLEADVPAPFDVQEVLPPSRPMRRQS